MDQKTDPSTRLSIVESVLNDGTRELKVRFAYAAAVSFMLSLGLFAYFWWDNSLAAGILLFVISSPLWVVFALPTVLPAIGVRKIMAVLRESPERVVWAYCGTEQITALGIPLTPHRLFICDDAGQRLAGFAPRLRLAEAERALFAALPHATIGYGDALNSRYSQQPAALRHRPAA